MRTFRQFLEAKAEFNSEGQPICPDCGVGLGYESADDRDTETMGGHNVEYLKCDQCGSQFELTKGGYDGPELYPHGTSE